MKDLKYLNKFLWKYRFLLLTGSIFILIANLFALFPAEFVRKAFDVVINNTHDNNQDIKQIRKIVLRYAGLIVLFASFLFS